MPSSPSLHLLSLLSVSAQRVRQFNRRKKGQNAFSQRCSMHYGDILLLIDNNYCLHRDHSIVYLDSQTSLLRLKVPVYTNWHAAEKRKEFIYILETKCF